MERFSVKKARGIEDFRRVESLCKDAFPGNEVALAVRDLYTCSSDDRFTCLIAEDMHDESIAGCIFLLHTPVMYEGHQLASCELNFLASRSDLSGTGVASTLINSFFNESSRQGYAVVLLEGIPHYYRKYGFNYAIPIQKQVLDVKNLNYQPAEAVGVRRAKTSDLEFIRCCHEKDAEKIALLSVVTHARLKRQIECYKSDLMRMEYFIIEIEGIPSGYFAIEPDESEMIVTNISSSVSFSCMDGLISHIIDRKLGEVINQDRIVFRIAEGTKPHTYLRMLGAIEESNYARQVRITDIDKLFRSIAPVLEKRVSSSCFASETVSFQLNDFSNLYEIVFRCSKMSFVRRKFVLTTEFNLPPQALVKLVFGDADYWSIKNILPDCHIDKRLIPFAEILFPRMNHSVFRSF